MSSKRSRIKYVMLVLFLSLSWSASRSEAQNTATQKKGTPQTGYAIKKPVFGGACPVCPWGAMAEVVKSALQPYGWDVQICYYCAGGPREARIVAGAMMATPPDHPGTETLPTPNGPVDFGVTGAEFLQAAYLGTNDFAKDPEGPRKHLRMIANIQEPTYFIVAVKASLGITDLSEIAQKRLPVKLVAWAIGQRQLTPEVLSYYNLSKENIESFGGTYATSYSRDADVDVIVGFGSLVNAPEYNIWYQATQKYDFKYLELAQDLREKLAKKYYLLERNMPLGLFRGVDHRFPTLVQLGTVIYGRTDMPDDFAYTLAKAMDEKQELLAFTHMNWSYNWHTVWKAHDVPLHPGAGRYYRERGYMK